MRPLVTCVCMALGTWFVSDPALAQAPEEDPRQHKARPVRDADGEIATAVCVMKGYAQVQTFKALGPEIKSLALSVSRTWPKPLRGRLMVEVEA